MNKKGIFITFMVFMLSASILLLHDATKRTDFKLERKHIDQAAFNNVNNLFNNIYEEVVSLNKEGAARDIQERAMPFGYGFEQNSLTITQRVPVREALLEAYIDALNIYRVFTASSASADLNINTGTLIDTRWGGTTEYPDLNYAILPQCLLYDINSCCFDTNLMILKELQDGELGCVGGFDYADLNIVDINVSINSAGCDLSSGITGNLSGKADAYNPADPEPYLRIWVTEAGTTCPGTTPEDCPVTREANGTKLITAHFDPESFNPATEIDSLLISCGAEQWLRVKVGKQDAGDTNPIVIYNSIPSYPADVDVNIVFDQAIELFYFTGFSVSVEKDNFPIKRST